MALKPWFINRGSPWQNQRASHSTLVSVMDSRTVSHLLRLPRLNSWTNNIPTTTTRHGHVARSVIWAITSSGPSRVLGHHEFWAITSSGPSRVLGPHEFLALTSSWPSGRYPLSPTNIEDSTLRTTSDLGQHRSTACRQCVALLTNEVDHAHGAVQRRLGSSSSATTRSQIVPRRTPGDP